MIRLYPSSIDSNLYSEKLERDSSTQTKFTYFTLIYLERKNHANERLVRSLHLFYLSKKLAAFPVGLSEHTLLCASVFISRIMNEDGGRRNECCRKLRFSRAVREKSYFRHHDPILSMYRVTDSVL